MIKLKYYVMKPVPSFIPFIYNTKAYRLGFIITKVPHSAIF